MIKTAFSTLGCPGWTWNRIIAEAKKSGIDALELRGVSGELDIMKIPELSPEIMARTRKELGNIKISNFGSSVKLDTPVLFDKNIEDGKVCIDRCSEIGIKAIRIFGDTVPVGEGEIEALCDIAEGINLLCGYAADKNVEIWLEVHGNMNTTERMAVIQKAVTAPNFGFVWDVAHSDRVYFDNFMPFYKQIKPQIKHIHIKDHIRKYGKTELTDVGSGDIPLIKIITTLINDGYDGYFSLEWEKQWHPELKDLDEELPYFLSVIKAAGGEAE